MFSFIKKAGTGVVSDKDEKEKRKRDKKDRKDKHRASMSADELLRLDEVGRTWGGTDKEVVVVDLVGNVDDETSISYLHVVDIISFNREKEITVYKKRKPETTNSLFLPLGQLESIST